MYFVMNIKNGEEDNREYARSSSFLFRNFGITLPNMFFRKLFQKIVSCFLPPEGEYILERSLSILLCFLH